MAAVGPPLGGLKPHEQIVVEKLADTNIVRAGISGIGGLGLGILFGIFSASLGANVHEEVPKGLRESLLEAARSSWFMGKNFGKVGLYFSGVEGAIETYRAKADYWNGLTAGCIVGGAFAYSAAGTSWQAVATGCVGFAAFSGAIDWLTSRHA